MRKTFLCAALLFATVFATAGQAADEWKLVIKVKGQVQTKFANSDSWITVWSNRLLRDGQDRIRTLKDSIGQVKTSDGAVIAMGPETDITLTEFDVRTGRMRVKMSDQKGGIRARLSRFLRGERNFEVQTPNAVLAARGTDYVVLYSPTGLTDDTASRLGPVAVLPGFEEGLAQGGPQTICQVFEGTVGVSTGNSPPTILMPGERAIIGNSGVTVMPSPNDGLIPAELTPEPDEKTTEKGTYVYFHNEVNSTLVQGQDQILLPNGTGQTGTVEVLINIPGGSSSPYSPPSPRALPIGPNN